MVKKKSNVEKVATPEELSEHLARASAIEAISHTDGWRMLMEDVMLWKERIVNQIIYLDKDSKEFQSARVLAVALSQLPILIGQYSGVKEQIEADLKTGDDATTSIPKYWDEH